MSIEHQLQARIRQLELKENITEAQKEELKKKKGTLAGINLSGSTFPIVYDPSNRGDGAGINLSGSTFPIVYDPSNRGDGEGGGGKRMRGGKQAILLDDSSGAGGGPETGPHIAKAVSNTFSQPASIASTTTPASYTLFPLVFALCTAIFSMYTGN